MKYQFKYNKDFGGVNPDTITGHLTTWPEKIHVEAGTDSDTHERILTINLGTEARALGARRIRELLKKLEK